MLAKRQMYWPVRLKRSACQIFDQRALLKLFSLTDSLHDASTAMFNMAHVGNVFHKDGQFIAKIDTSESGTRFAMAGPPRDDEQQAAQDLSFIRAAADGLGRCR